MRMRSFLLWVVFGLFASVKSTTVHSQTEDDDVLREAATDGFLIDQLFPSLNTTELPGKTTTVQPSHRLLSTTQTSDAQASLEDFTEGSAASANDDLTFMQKDEHNPTIIPTSTFTQMETTIDFSSSRSSLMSADVPDVSITHSSFHQTTDSSSFFSGSGDGLDLYTTTSSSVTFSSDTETASSHSTLPGVGSDIPGSEGSGSGPGMPDVRTAETDRHPENSARVDGSQNTKPSSPKGHVTPDWIIILGFVVGVAALIMLCVAIATRDKWNGPSRARPLQASPAHQQREVEMETFLHKDAPQENGKAAEYTVIPVDELPDKCSH